MTKTLALAMIGFSLMLGSAAIAAQRQGADTRFVPVKALVADARKETFSYGADERQALDVYIPPATQDAPVIVMVHGGAWKVGDKANAAVVDNKVRYWLPKGYIFVSVNYRMLPDAMAYEQAEDVAEALRYVQGHVAAWGGNPDRIVLMGHSAGAHIAALLSSKPSMVGSPWAGTVVLDTAVVQVSAIMRRRHAAFYDEAFGKDPAYWAKASPMDQWAPGAVPMLLVCSTQRRDDSCGQAEAFQAMVVQAGGEMPLLHEDLSHREINKTLGLPSAYTTAVDAFITARLSR